MSMTPLPDAPQPTDALSTFNSKSFAMVAALPLFVTEANALQADVTAKQTAAAGNQSAAAASATAAAASQSAAATSAQQAAAAYGAPVWVSGTTYALGDVVWSPANARTYRRIVAGAGTTDPSADATNWRLAFDASANAETFFYA